MASHHHHQQAAGDGDYNMDLANFDIADFMQSAGPPAMDPPAMFSGNSRPSNDSMNNGGNAIQSSNPNQPAGGNGRPSSLSVAAAGNSVLDHHTNNPYALPSSSDHHQIMFGMDQQSTSQGIPPQGMPPQARNGQPAVNTVFPRGLVTAETLKLQLQQQLRLQQLQQLQNQILQQQIELISGQSQQQREMLMHGLLTPASSSELRPTTMHREYLSPMTLQAQQYSQTPDPNAILNNMVSPAMTPQTTATTGAMTGQSAFQQPSHIAPMDMFSPLTSPALGPTIGVAPSAQRLYNQAEWSSSMSSLATSGNGSTSPQRPDATLPTDQAFLRTGSNKRPFEDTNLPSARKRLSPLVKATGGSNAMSQPNVGQQRKTRSRNARPSLTAAELSQATISTPSPIDVDMSMPPPPPPEGPEPDPSRSQCFGGGVDQPQPGESNSMSSSSQPSPSIEPITPASMLNLGHSARLPTGLVHNVPMTGGPIPELPMGPITMRQAQLAEALSAPANGSPEPQAPDNAAKKGKNVAPPKGKGVAAGGTRSTKPSPVIRPMGSTTPKTILPVGMSAEAASQLSQKSNYQSLLERNTRTGPLASNNSNAAGSSSPSSSQIVPEVKKNSHKGAEQKRRDALKAGFDELRLLLPPIVIDPDSDEPLLPGSAPPRGPQRNLPPGSEDHPNRSVSKLALLKCSNEYIGRLNKRVDRRDLEIALLRDELRWLRLKTGLGPEMGESDEREWMDLERDVDEPEREDPNLGLAAITSGMKIKGSANSVPESPNLDESNKKGRATKKAGGRAREKQASMDIVDDDDDD